MSYHDCAGVDVTVLNFWRGDSRAGSRGGGASSGDHSDSEAVATLSEGFQDVMRKWSATSRKHVALRKAPAPSTSLASLATSR